MQAYDVVIIGAGHNALVCAAYLLKAGYSVLLLEKNSIPGGGAIPGMPGRNCARVFLQQQHPLRERLADARNSLTSTAKSVLNIQ
jgi:ribulose 1,5-bisphosphate synthetase/thiazole synthase